MIRPEDPHLADALGRLAATLENFDEARPLMARRNAQKSFEALQEYVEEREDKE